MKIWPIAVGASALLALAGCNLFKGTTPPSAVEGALYKTITNYVDIPVLKTNVVVETQHVVVNETNQIGQVVFHTNDVLVPHFETVMVTNHVAVYELSTSDQAKNIAQTGGSILNTFFPGTGSMVASGLLALLAGWGHLRSYKRGQTNDALSQEAETILEFVKSLPSGTSYIDAITSWMQAHQGGAGVAGQMKAILDSRDKPLAKEEAAGIRDTINTARVATAIPEPPKG